MTLRSVAVVAHPRTAGLDESGGRRLQAQIAPRYLDSQILRKRQLHASRSGVEESRRLGRSRAGEIEPRHPGSPMELQALDLAPSQPRERERTCPARHPEQLQIHRVARL